MTKGGNTHYCTLSSAIFYDSRFEGMQFPGKMRGRRRVEGLGRDRHLAPTIENMLGLTRLGGWALSP